MADYLVIITYYIMFCEITPSSETFKVSTETQYMWYKTNKTIYKQKKTQKSS